MSRVKQSESNFNDVFFTNKFSISIGDQTWSMK